MSAIFPSSMQLSPELWTPAQAAPHALRNSQRRRRRAVTPARALWQTLLSASSPTAPPSPSATPQPALLSEPVREQQGGEGGQTVSFSAQVISSISEVSQEDWDACATGSGEVNPFLLWSFLHALEESKSVATRAGWLPQHVLLRGEGAEEGAPGELLACCPLYLKGHSYGEYVFDNSWAHLYAQRGQRYYPKLQAAVPFTPATGPRLLIKATADKPLLAKALAKCLVQLTEQYGVSGLHMTFNQEGEWEDLAQYGFLQRTGIQYHWLNKGYATFNDFLMDLRQSKRKSIRQERKKVAGSGYALKRLTGGELKAAHWDSFYKFYRNTTDRKWGQAYLTREFFHILGESMGDNVLLATAQDGSGELVAGALNLVGDKTLFGRNWGCAYGLDVPFLHFELCYYQALEAAIEMKLERVEAGAQGEHKIQRGYLPSLTYSSHYLADDSMRSAIGRYLDRERENTEYTMRALTLQESPYKDALATVSQMSFGED